ncbi:hypothetical protein HMPREF9141_0672 [Prevotella multiformis DSM 16608]|uniref:Uncharacterized protein n=1 Tax=Prevotella multiformis DSM 16608 TaxID=888743 RepID=F0F506_9BACT|nr:hypothetical protein HMPREF9141_0672 [Prevotella multiformis DSM 16608]
MLAEGGGQEKLPGGIGIRVSQERSGKRLSCEYGTKIAAHRAVNVQLRSVHS